MARDYIEGEIGYVDGVKSRYSPEGVWIPDATTQGSTDPAGGSRIVTETPGEARGQFRLPTGGGALGGAYQDLLAAQTIDQQTPEQIRGAYTQQYQAFIDSINLAYGQQIATAQQQGVQREGQARAIQSRGGILGTGMAGAQTAGVQAETRDVVASIEAQRSAKIASIMGNIDTRVEARLETQRKAKITKAETTIAILKEQQTDTLEDIKGLAQQGVTFDQLNPQDATDIQELMDWSPFQLEQYFNVNQPQPAKYEWGWKGDNYVGVKHDGQGNLIDTVTYTAEEMGIPQEKKGDAIEFFTTADGQMFWYDENDSINPDGTLKSFPIGGKKAGRAPTGFESKKFLLDQQLAEGTITQEQYNEALLGVEAEGNGPGTSGDDFFNSL